MTKAIAVIRNALLKVIGISIGAAIMEIPLLVVTAPAYVWLGWFGALIGVSIAAIVILWFVTIQVSVEYVGHILLFISLDGVVNTFLSEYGSPTTPVIFVVVKLFFFQPFAGVLLLYFFSGVIKDILEKPPKLKQG